MRKIISKHEEEKRKKRNQLLVGGILIAVMLLSTLGYAFQNYLYGNTSSAGTNQTVSYNGINFLNQNNYWVTQYLNQRLAFSYNPLQISLLNLSGTSMNLNSLENKTLYVYSEDYNSESELRVNLLHFTGEIQNACPEGIQCNQSFYPGQQLSSENCSNNFIIIQNGPPEIKQEQNCIFISGQGQDLITSTDNFLFKVFGITQ